MGATSGRTWPWVICLEIRAKEVGNGGYSSREVGNDGYTP